MHDPVGMKEFMCEDRGCVHKVVIYKEGCKYRVEPGRLVVHPGAKIAIISLVKPDPPVSVWFPQGVKAPGPLPVPYGKPQVVVAGTDYGAFPYSVFVPDDRGADFAEGGSSARIIVADP
jgi:hypothetical protein